MTIRTVNLRGPTLFGGLSALWRDAGRGVRLVAAAALIAGTLGATAHAAGLTRQTVSFDGEDRPYEVYVSSKASRNAYNFVVFALPDNGQTAEQFAEQSGWVKLAEDNGFAVVFPEPVKGVWAPNSGGEDAYLKAVFDHAKSHLTVAAPEGAPRGGRPEGGGGEGGAGRNPNRAPTWLPWYYLTGSGAGGTAAEGFAMNYPGLFAGVATLNAAPLEAAYRQGDAPAQGYFQYMRAGKNAAPFWKQLKKDVPVAVWLFNSGDGGAGLTKQVDYWKHSDAASGAAEARTIQGLATTVYSNASNPSQQVRVTKLVAGRAYDGALSATVWNDFFAHTARWTSSANGDLGPMLTEAEVNKAFEVKSLDVGDGRPYKYYVKTPSSYRPGQHLPVVIATHGAFFPAWLYLSQIRFHDLGEREGFITVYANGHNNIWDFTKPEGSDQKFLNQLVADLSRDYGVDRGRVYLQGFSFGSGLTFMMGVSYPQLFAAVSPNNGIGPMSKEVTSWIGGVKAKSDVRMPMMIVYGDVDSGASVDATIPAQGVLRDAIDLMKSFDHIAGSDRYETVSSPNAEPYQVLIPGAKVVHAGVDARFPMGRFTVYQYASADPKPLDLFQLVWVKDLPHGADLREAKLEWDFFKHWSRGADGSLTYVP